jgi:hypothetical protein
MTDDTTPAEEIVGGPEAGADDHQGDNGAKPFPGEPADHTAPYGRDRDGVLLDRDGKRAPYGLAKSGKRKRNRPDAKPSPAQRARPHPPAGTTIARKRARAVAELFDLPAAGCIGLGLQRNDYRFIAQADTFQTHGPALGKALAELAEDNARLGQVLDRLTETGPYFALGLAVVGMAAQTARNFGQLPGEMAAMLGGKDDPVQLATTKLEQLGVPVRIEEPQADGATAAA